MATGQLMPRKNGAAVAGGTDIHTVPAGKQNYYIDLIVYNAGGAAEEVTVSIAGSEFFSESIPSKGRVEFNLRQNLAAGDVIRIAGVVNYLLTYVERDTP